MDLLKKNFGVLPDGRNVIQYILDNKSMKISLLNYGCIITSIKVPDGINKSQGEVVMGFDNFESYLNPHPYFGAIIGPVANRISDAKYLYQNNLVLLDANEGKNQLHGGSLAFDKVLWSESKIIEEDDFIRVELSYKRPDGLMGFPGNLELRFTLTLYSGNRVDLNYYCTTDKPTPINLTHHDYFNLKDGGSSSILDHQLQINAEHYTPTKENNCVTGEIKKLLGSPFDYTSYKSVRKGIHNLYGNVSAPKGFDHNFVLSGKTPIAASVKCEESKRQLDIYTNKKCIQFYTSNFLDGTLGRIDNEFKPFNALCLETQSFPDAVNQNNFPSIILEPSNEYDFFTSYVFNTF